MSVAVDSSVLWSIFKGEPAGRVWLEKLVVLRRQGSLLACEVVWAETRPAFATGHEHADAMGRLGVQYRPLEERAAGLTGEHFARYRRLGGPRRRILPDFLVGAHARALGVAIASDEEGFFRSYFLGLTVVRP